jgi:hypothetical protein
MKYSCSPPGYVLQVRALGGAASGGDELVVLGVDPALHHHHVPGRSLLDFALGLALFGNLGSPEPGRAVGRHILLVRAELEDGLSQLLGLLRALYGLQSRLISLVVVRARVLLDLRPEHLQREADLAVVGGVPGPLHILRWFRSEPSALLLRGLKRRLRIRRMLLPTLNIEGETVIGAVGHSRRELRLYLHDAPHPQVFELGEQGVFERWQDGGIEGGVGDHLLGELSSPIRELLFFIERDPQELLSDGGKGLLVTELLIPFRKPAP